MRREFALALPVALCLFLVPFSFGQNPHIPIPPATPQSQDLRVGVPNSDSKPGTVGPDASSNVSRQQAIAANLQRQREIRRDFQRLLQLTHELNDYFDRTNDNVASVDAMKKAEQIEKLAKSLRSKMKQSF